MPEPGDLISPLDFPYDAVVAEFHSTGKHFVGTGLLRTLDGMRATVRELGRFLDVALDKWDDRYDYRTYLALDLLPLPDHDRDGDVDAACRRQDRLVVQLVADALRFELDTADGVSDELPRQRPPGSTVAKRYRLGLRSVEAAADRLGLVADDPGADPERAARALCALVEADRGEAEARALKLSNLPVYVSHDEYMFIRILQAFEATFALLAVCLRAAVRELAKGEAERAVRRLELAGSRLAEAARLFSLLATMQVEAFRTFRLYTDGASAIQSRNYKVVEALCRRPDQERLDSPAYRSVPEVRARVVEGQTTLHDAVVDATARGLLDHARQEEVARAMNSFASTLVQWRQTHYRLAVRMLGELGGTGSTEGTPYLDRIRHIPVFPEGGAS